MKPLPACAERTLSLAGRIPNLPRIIASRNVLIHGYATVDDRLVWGVVEGELPRLLAHLTQLLDWVEEGKPISHR